MAMVQGLLKAGLPQSFQAQFKFNDKEFARKSAKTAYHTLFSRDTFAEQGSEIQLDLIKEELKVWRIALAGYALQDESIKSKDLLNRYDLLTQAGVLHDVYVVMKKLNDIKKMEDFVCEFNKNKETLKKGLAHIKKVKDMDDRTTNTLTSSLKKIKEHGEILVKQNSSVPQGLFKVL